MDVAEILGKLTVSAELRRLEETATLKLIAAAHIPAAYASQFLPFFRSE